eukprot:g21677.t1
MAGVGKVDEPLELLTGARGSTDMVINIVEKEVRDGAGVAVEGGLLCLSSCTFIDSILHYFINDLPSIIRSEMRMIADDYAMFSTVRDSSDTEAVHVQMQQD